MTALSRRAPQVIAILLIVAAGLFVIGVTAEDDKATHSAEPAAESREHDEVTEADDGEGDEGAESPGAERTEGETGETLDDGLMRSSYHLG